MMIRDSGLLFGHPVYYIFIFLTSLRERHANYSVNASRGNLSIQYIVSQILKRHYVQLMGQIWHRFGKCPQ